MPCVRSADENRMSDWWKDRLVLALLVVAAALSFMAFTLVAVELAHRVADPAALATFIVGLLVMGTFIGAADWKRNQMRRKDQAQWECMFCGQRIEPVEAGLDICSIVVTTSYDQPVRRQHHGQYFAHAACLGSAANDGAGLWASLGIDSR
jgi:hypothetical protein